jgi:hypothetical protein
MQTARRWAFRIAALVTLGALGAATPSCASEEPSSGSNYYDRKIGPILSGACIVSATGSSCHVTADDFGNALGNLDVTSYEMLDKRRDSLINYGPYGMPNLLLKAVPPYTMSLTAWDGTPTTVTTDITHAGGSLIDVPSSVFSTLQRWLANGALRNNSPESKPAHVAKPCSPKVGADPAFDRNVDPSSPHYGQFSSSVNRLLVDSCGAGNCHGAAGASLYITCGDTPEQIRWNYFAARDYVTGDPDRSELLRRTLEPAQGGVYHEGGAIFPETAHADYQVLRGWIEAEGGPANVPVGEGFDIFAKRVQPLLARRGCMVVGCHSPIGFNDYVLRGGSGGYFSLPVTRGNYRASLKNSTVESPDPNASRLVRKNLPPHPAGTGIRHRGGALMGEGGDPSQCDETAALTGPLDEQSLYCVITAWLTKERLERSASFEPLTGIVYVRRPPPAGPDTAQDFEAYSPGADLRLAGASMDAQGTIALSGTNSSLMAGCGLDPASADVRRPAVSWDGRRIAFGARVGASEPLRIYVMNADGSNCQLEPSVDLAPVDEKGEAVPTNGELVHNFDPSFAPDGRMVFVSTRGNTKPTVMDLFFKGPQRTPADPGRLNANLYVLEDGKIRQLTFMLNQDLTPSFMSNGQLVFVKEKRTPGFYQLAGRRINLDGGDYHPLFGQRGSIGANQLTDLVQLSDHNFAAIFSDRGAKHGAGTVAIINRSLGPDTISQDPGQYPLDPEAINKVSPVFFQHSVSFPDPNARSGLGAGTQGAYRNPSALPNAQMLVSYAANVVDLASVNGNFDVVMLDPVSGQRTPLPGLSEPNLDEVWAVAVYGKVSHGVFETTLFTGVQGAGVVYTEDDAEPRLDRMDLTFLDVNVLVPLVFQNTRAGRPILGLEEFEIWIDLPPEEGVKSLDQQSPFIVDDQFGRVHARRSYFGTVPLLADDSARVQAPGGVPIYLAARVQLPGESQPNLHFTREEIQFYPGEWTRFSHRREVFNGFCGGCHGSISGKEFDVAATPDIMSGASKALAVTAKPFSLMTATPAAPQGPPFL